MRLLQLLVILAFLLSSAVSATSLGQVTKDTQLFEKPTAKSKKLKRLKADQKVSVKRRKGGWYEVSINELEGWMRMFYLRFSPQNPGESRLGVGALLGSTNKPHSDITLTTGVRGITEKQLKNSKPAFSVLSELSLNASNAKEAEKFAQREKLKVKKVKYAKVKE
ncbi:SH3 domain-containing protein [Pleionea sediminis]|uniref:SH3 domain-containing protein n=1 Tax=Pleionea sediminis TaxID=2569479 RepID=UPI001185580A|nr:SH3 domain-containing protein [Pleionea sediminis]